MSEARENSQPEDDAEQWETESNEMPAGLLDFQVEDDQEGAKRDPFGPEWVNGVLVGVEDFLAHGMYADFDEKIASLMKGIEARLEECRKQPGFDQARSVNDVAAPLLLRLYKRKTFPGSGYPRSAEEM